MSQQEEAKRFSGPLIWATMIIVAIIAAIGISVLVGVVRHQNVVSEPSATTPTTITSAPNTTTETTTTTTAPSTTTTTTEFPQGNSAPVEPPRIKGINPAAAGYTTGDLTTSEFASAPTVGVETATVGPHWGFTYVYNCDKAADDGFRQAHPGGGSFTVVQGDLQLFAGDAYSGSGFVEVKDDPRGGEAQRLLTVSGPCVYRLTYVSYPKK